ncbi:MAG: glycosyltransferase family 39 protein [Armatimonadetes bacterium]|nr:glycosyltransferase family 39 protein [Armatimonadota bacterium]
MREWWPVAVVAALFVTVCLFFSSATPYRTGGAIVHGVRAVVPDIGAPDERQHANYVGRLMKGDGFPVLVAGSPDAYENYQAHQPPAYYVLAAGWCKLTGTDPTSPNGQGLRFLSTLIGVATVVGLFLGAKWAGGSNAVAWASTAAALMPMSVALHSAASNDPLLIGLCTWVLALLFKGLRDGFDTKSLVATVLLTGAALLTKTTALALLPCLLLGAVFARSHATSPLRPAAFVALLLGPVVLAAPWWWRNVGLYGDPFAMKAFNEAFLGSPQAATFIGGLGAATYWSNMVAWWTARSAIGVFGYMDIFLFENLNMDKSSSIYVALMVVAAVPVSAGLVRSFRSVRTGKGGVVVLAAVFAGLVAVLFVGFNARYFQGQARYLYPALGPAAWCTGAGLCALMRERREWAWAVGALLLLGLDLVAWSQLGPAFALRTSV